MSKTNQLAFPRTYQSFSAYKLLNKALVVQSWAFNFLKSVAVPRPTIRHMQPSLQDIVAFADRFISLRTWYGYKWGKRRVDEWRVVRSRYIRGVQMSITCCWALTACKRKPCILYSCSLGDAFQIRHVTLTDGLTWTRHPTARFCPSRSIHDGLVPK